MLVLKTPRAARASSLRSLDVPLEVLKKSRERRELLQEILQKSNQKSFRSRRDHWPMAPAVENRGETQIFFKKVFFALALSSELRISELLLRNSNSSSTDTHSNLLFHELLVPELVTGDLV